MLWFCMLMIVIILLIWYKYYGRMYLYVYLIRKNQRFSRSKSPENMETILNDVVIEKDVEYQSNDIYHTYDCYRPSIGENLPIIVWVHGGSYIGGDKDVMRNFGPMLAQQGYCVFSMNYERSPKAKFPRQLIQIDDFIQEVVCKLQKQYHLNIHSICLGGNDTGGQMVSNYAGICIQKSIQQQLEWEPKLSSHFDDIKGLMLFCTPFSPLELVQDSQISKKEKRFFNSIGSAYLGLYHWYKRDILSQVSPYTQIDEHYVPCYIVDGNEYSFPKQAQQMVEILKANKVFVMSDIYDEDDYKLPHEFQFDYERYPKEATHIYKQTLIFLKNIMNKNQE